MKYLVFGHKGQLGKEFCSVFERQDAKYKGYDIDEIDIGDAGQVLAAVASFKPTIIINCSAYNFVDKAEEEPALAFRVNAEGVKNIALAANRVGAFVVHYSSDYVFNGNTNKPYTEEGNPAPLNKYGESKREGEILLEKMADRYLLLRLSWVYGDGNQNFIFKLKKWAKQKEKLQIAEDEISVPTSTKTIATVTLSALENDLRGLYHLPNSGYASRYEWAKEILKNYGIDKEIIPVSKEIFNLAARRPNFSAMSNKKISDELKTTIPDWQVALKEFIGNH